MKLRSCSLHALLLYYILVSVQTQLSAHGCAYRSSFCQGHRCQKCEIVQAEKACNELETQIKALYRDKYIPSKEAHQAGKAVVTAGAPLHYQSCLTAASF